MARVMPARFYGDPANVVDELRRMREMEAKRQDERLDFKKKLEKEINEWREGRNDTKSN